MTELAGQFETVLTVETRASPNEEFTPLELLYVVDSERPPLTVKEIILKGGDYDFIAKGETPYHRIKDARHPKVFGIVDKEIREGFYTDDVFFTHDINSGVVDVRGRFVENTTVDLNSLSSMDIHCEYAQHRARTREIKFVISRRPVTPTPSGLRNR